MYRVLIAICVCIACLITPCTALTISFAWDASISPEVTGYKLYAGVESRTYTQNVDVGNQLAYGWEYGWIPGTPYYFAATAYTATAESLFSNEVTYTVAQAPDTTPPTTPGIPVITTASSSQLNLSWTASTDDVGVTGYRVERCQGAGCITWAEIAQPTTASYVNTGLSASTLYRYRVRATDAANNLSAYSAIGEGTTQAAALAGPVRPAAQPQL